MLYPLDHPRRLALLLTPCCLFAALSLAGCGGSEEIQEQQVTSGSESIRPEQPTAREAAYAGAAAGDAAYAPAASGTVSRADDRPNWVLPAGWKLDPAPRQMRHSTYRAPAGDTVVEVAISQFPGDVGGMVANVNRWRSQVGLSPVDEAAAEALIERFDLHPGYAGYTVHLQGETTHMLVGSIFNEAANRTWYVRATLPPAAAASLRPALFAFTRSFGISDQ
ncbi:MAG: hypothetical protein EA402_13530 [Planctomycetota bacterium]|nr:MAG: hypothetical protein EA402_13530 [Planctomycetota bacterium]